MNYNELLNMLDIKEGSEFEYFENFSDLVECEDDISNEILFRLFKEVEKTSVADIIGNYFDEVLESIPDDSVDIYSLLETIKRVLIGLISTEEDDNTIANFAEELNRFRIWYSYESQVLLHNLKDGSDMIVSVRDALVASRLEALDGDEYQYDFDQCLDYELDEFIMSYGHVSFEQSEDYENDSLIDNGYLYDDEMKGN